MSESSIEKVSDLRPAFATNAQIIAFSALILLILLLPVIISRSGAISRQNSYQMIPEHWGAYSFAENEIYDNSEDIDILFVGNSVMWHAIDAESIQRSLSAELGRPARVRVFGQNFSDLDITYTKIRDAVEQKRVRMVVVSALRLPYTSGPSFTTYRFFGNGEYPDSVDGLPVGSRISLYAGNVLRVPHELLTMLRPHRTVPSPYARDLGAYKVALGMGREPDLFEAFSPEPPSIPAAQLLLSSQSANKFHFTDEAIPQHQRHYLNRLVDLAKQRGFHLALINLPLYNDRHSDVVLERHDWHREFGPSVSVIGVAPKDLFTGLTEKEIEKLYADEEHFNKNGNAFFTQTLLPAMITSFKQNANTTR